MALCTPTPSCEERLCCDCPDVPDANTASERTQVDDIVGQITFWQGRGWHIAPAGDDQLPEAAARRRFGGSGSGATFRDGWIRSSEARAAPRAALSP